MWNLGQPGHPRHINFGVELPREPYTFVDKHWSRSMWIVTVYVANETHCIFVSLPSPNILINALFPCKCINTDTQTCALEQQKLSLKASMSSHSPMICMHFAGDRFIIQGTFLPPEVNINDCWKQQAQTGDFNILSKCVNVVRNFLFGK